VTKQNSRSAKDQKFNERIRRCYPSMAAGNTEAAMEIVAADATLHVPGSSLVAGEYRGPAGMVEYYRTLRDTSQDLDVRVEDTATAASQHVVWLRVGATRNGIRFEDRQCLQLEIADDKISRAWLYPRDLAHHDRFWHQRLPFAPSDQLVMAQAVRDAVASTKRSDAPALFTLAVALIAAAALIVAYDRFQDWHPSADFRLESDSITELRHVTLSGEGVSWSLTGARVERVDVTGPEEGRFELSLPIPDSQCAPIAAELNAVCLEGAVVIDTPLTVSWSRGQTLSTNGIKYAADSVDVSLQHAEQRGYAVSILAFGTPTPSVCFGTLLSKAKVRIVHGSQVAERRLSSDPIVACGHGLRLLIGTDGQGAPPALDLSGIESITLEVEGDVSTMQGYSGQVRVLGEEQVLASPADVVLLTDGPATTTITIQDGSEASLVVPPSRSDGGSPATHTAGALPSAPSSAASVTVDGAELVPSGWERYSAVIGPLFGAAVAVFVVTPLGLAVKGFMDWWSGAWAHARRLRRRFLQWLKSLPRPWSTPGRGSADNREEG
jgi:ketosteroid isomerase-like protein